MRDGTKLTLTDLSGRSLLQKDIKIQSGKQFTPFHLQQLASGIYFVTVSFEQIKSTQKLVLVK